jgi:hypothetical protein
LNTTQQRSSYSESLHQDSLHERCTSFRQVNI